MGNRDADDVTNRNNNVSDGDCSENRLHSETESRVRLGKSLCKRYPNTVCGSGLLSRWLVRQGSGKYNRHLILLF